MSSKMKNVWKKHFDCLMNEKTIAVVVEGVRIY